MDFFNSIDPEQTFEDFLADVLVTLASAKFDIRDRRRHFPTSE